MAKNRKVMTESVDYADEAQVLLEKMFQKSDTYATPTLIEQKEMSSRVLREADEDEGKGESEFNDMIPDYNADEMDADWSEDEDGEEYGEEENDFLEDVKIFKLNKSEEIEDDAKDSVKESVDGDIAKLSFELNYKWIDGEDDDVYLVIYDGDLFDDEEDSSLDDLKGFVSDNFKEVTVSDEDFDFVKEKIGEEEGEATESKKTKKKAVKGSKESARRVEVTNELINNYMLEKDHKLFAYAVNSLLSFVKSKDTKVYESVHKLLDPNMVVSWYLLVQPSARMSGKHIPDSVFNKWANKAYKSPVKSVELIRELMSSNNYDNKEC
jgi:hypothetical protein